MASPKKFSTLAVHAGDRHATAHGATESALVFSNTFAFDSADDAREIVSGASPGFVYSRWGNPTVRTFEEKVAALEGAEAAVGLASGMAAVSGAVEALVRTGDHVLFPEAVYGETVRLAGARLARFGVESTFVDMTDLPQVAAALRPNTKVVWTETPANPTLAITDLAAVVQVAHGAGARVITDSTFATPYHQRPLALGVDLVVHSATKALGGHGDAIGGVVAGSRELVDRVRDDAVRVGGAPLAPMNAWLLSRGLVTLPLRAKAAAESAFELARRLAVHPRVERVHYPGLPSHPGHAVAVHQMERGFGAVLAFEVKGGIAAGKAVHDRVALIARAVSLGDVRSLMTHSATTTHHAVPKAQRERAGITDGLVRLSVGIEDVEDLWADLDAALGK